MIDLAHILAIAERETNRLKDTHFHLELKLPSVMSIVAVIQLSLRHPDLPEEARTAGQTFCDTIIELISCESKDLGDFLKLGFDPKYDAKTKPHEELRGPKEDHRPA